MKSFLEAHLLLAFAQFQWLSILKFYKLYKYLVYTRLHKWIYMYLCVDIYMCLSVPVYVVKILVSIRSGCAKSTLIHRSVGKLCYTALYSYSRKLTNWLVFGEHKLLVCVMCVCVCVGIRNLIAMLVKVCVCAVTYFFPPQNSYSINMLWRLGLCQDLQAFKVFML